MAYGLNFRTAPLELREQVAFPTETLHQVLQDLCRDVSSINEAAILSTCNRTEIYCATDHEGDVISPWLAGYRGLNSADLHPCVYTHHNQDAAHHLMRVASGLDSQVLGEPQIMGQVKTAYEVAREAGSLGPVLNLLSQHTLNVAKRVRSDTDIGRNPISVAYAAVTMAKQIFADLSERGVLLLGAGETVELLARHLRQQNIGHMTIANRTLSHAQSLASQFDAQAIQLTNVAEQLHKFDIVIASTGSPLPVLGKGTVEAAIRQRKHQPMFMVDIAVPRDIEPEVAELRDAYLYTIDDLTEIIEENMSQRTNAAQSAEALVQTGALEYSRDVRMREGANLIQSFRAQANKTQTDEITRALKHLRSGEDPAKIIENLARNLTNKFMHTPTIAIRDASADGNPDLLETLRTLYQID